MQYEGNVWRALGIMAAAGGLRNAALLLRELRMPDAAAAFCAACKEAGFHSAYAPADAGQAAHWQSPALASSPRHMICRLSASRKSLPVHPQHPSHALRRLLSPYFPSLGVEETLSSGWWGELHADSWQCQPCMLKVVHGNVSHAC